MDIHNFSKSVELLTLKELEKIRLLGPVHTNECIDDESEVDEEGEDDIEFVEA